jgi:hypothetical protein
MQFLRSIALYTLDTGPVIETGHTTDGPGGIWRALLVDESVMAPPRAAIRWYADFGPKPPSKFCPNHPPASAAPQSNPHPTAAAWPASSSQCLGAESARQRPAVGSPSCFLLTFSSPLSLLPSPHG